MGDGPFSDPMSCDSSKIGEGRAGRGGHGRPTAAGCGGVVGDGGM